MYALKKLSQFSESEYSNVIKKVFDDEFSNLNLDDYLSTRQKSSAQHLKSLLDKRFELRIGAYFKNQLIGWSFGWQISEHEFYMVASGVVNAHRRQDVYTKLVLQVLKSAEEEGFQIVRSHHSVKNNAVIIAKLKQGFVISGMKVHESCGLLVELSFHISKIHRKAFELQSEHNISEKELLSTPLEPQNTHEVNASPILPI